MTLAAAKTEPSGQGRIPVLDIGAYLAGEAGAAAPLARAIARTCEDTGFLVVANHGVPQHLVDDTFTVAQEFFAQSPGSQLPVGAYSKPVVTWYVGDDDATAVPNGRDTAAARVDDSYVVGTGARANEPPIRNLLVQLGTLAAESFSNTDLERQRYEMLADKARENLSPADASAKVESIGGRARLGARLDERCQGTPPGD